MHSLKPSGDNIAQEFLRLLGQKDMVKAASDSETEDSVEQESFADDSDEGGEKKAEEHIAALEGLNPSTEEVLGWVEQLESFVESKDADSDDEPPSEDDDEDVLQVGSIDFNSLLADDAAVDHISRAETNVDDAIDLFEANASEKRVLDGLSKIAGGLVAKGEHFAADVVTATALSIKSDLKKEAAVRGGIVSELEKIASELYESADPLAGDIVQATINKIAQFVPGHGEKHPGHSMPKEESLKPPQKAEYKGCAEKFPPKEKPDEYKACVEQVKAKAEMSSGQKS